MPVPEEWILRFGGVCENPRLSVVIPFHRHDPSALLARLAHPPKGVEFILLDDGSGSADLLSRAITAAEALHTRTSIIVCARSKGRAEARNRLIAEALGEYVLFLEADILPDARDFISRWLALIEREHPRAAFGGLSVRQTQATPDTALHHDLFARSDCRSADERKHTPAWSTAAANLLVRRDLLAEIGFDDGFTGWGWEDVDWAIRATERASIVHIDNPATRAGLDDVDTLLRKCAEAGPNFARLARKHPRTVRRSASWRAARMLKRTPGRGALRSMFAWVARDPANAAPMALRRAAFKLYCASCSAEHLT